MRNIIMAFLLFVALPAWTQPAPPQPYLDNKTEILTKVAQEMAMGSGFKAGLRKAKPSNTAQEQALQTTLALPDLVYDVQFAQVIAPYLSLEDAEIAYAFHRSDTAKAIRSSGINHITPEQLSAYRAYMNSPIGQKFAKILTDDKTWSTYQARLVHVARG